VGVSITVNDVAPSGLTITSVARREGTRMVAATRAASTAFLATLTLLAVGRRVARLRCFQDTARRLGLMRSGGDRAQVSDICCCLLHGRIPHRTKGCRADVELPLKLLRRQKHRALSKGRDR
jgi:hypothetical protein